jgi:hypothetical protein
MDDSDLRAEMRRKGMAQAATFSWEAAGRQTAVSYQKALSAP